MKPLQPEDPTFPAGVRRALPSLSRLRCLGPAARCRAWGDPEEADEVPALAGPHPAGQSGPDAVRRPHPVPGRGDWLCGAGVPTGARVGGELVGARGRRGPGAWPTVGGAQEPWRRRPRPLQAAARACTPGTCRGLSAAGDHRVARRSCVSGDTRFQKAGRGLCAWPLLPERWQCCRVGSAACPQREQPRGPLAHKSPAPPPARLRVDARGLVRVWLAFVPRCEEMSVRFTVLPSPACAI